MSKYCTLKKGANFVDLEKNEFVIASSMTPSYDAYEEAILVMEQVVKHKFLGIDLGIIYVDAKNDPTYMLLLVDENNFSSDLLECEEE